MKIGFDAKRAVRNKTGLGNYSRLTIKTVADAIGADNVTLFSPDPIVETLRYEWLEGISRPELLTWETPRPNTSKLGATLWRTFGITRQLAHGDLNLYHGLSNELPLNINQAGVASVVTMHDVIYRRLPQCYNTADRFLYDLKYGRSCRNATRIIAISERTAQDVVEFYGVDRSKIDVIYQGCSSIFHVPVESDKVNRVKERYGINGRYVIQVGTIEYRKNLELSVKALSALPPDVTLVAIGRDRKGYLLKVMRTARDLGVANRIKVISGAPFEDLPALYAGAEISLYPSRYEGFGLPVLESLSIGTPVIAATGSCLEEAGGSAAFYVDADDANALAQISNKILSPGFNKGEITHAGKEHAARFNATDIAGALLKTYHRAIQEKTC